MPGITPGTHRGTGKGCREGCGEKQLIHAPLVTVLLRTNQICRWHCSGTVSLNEGWLLGQACCPLARVEQGAAQWERTLWPNLDVWQDGTVSECSRKTLFHLLMRKLKPRGYLRSHSLFSSLIAETAHSRTPSAQPLVAAGALGSSFAVSRTRGYILKVIRSHQS